jgi:glycosyltransferase involved in cell wall biosynthesis
MLSALASQRSGDLAGAETLYRQALAIRPDEPDCLHMLGVIHLETGRVNEAFEAIYRALARTGWRIETMRHNMVLVLVKRLAADTSSVRRVRQQYLEFCRGREARRVERDPLVSIVIPSSNHGRWIQKALESVYRQTYRRLELIVIDDGSSDGSPELIRQSLSMCPFPCRFVAGKNCGAHAAINQGVALATGEYFNVLHAGDWFPDDRIAVMVEHVARRDADWGFGGISYVDGDGRLIAPEHNRRVFDSLMRFAQISKWETLGAALLKPHPAIHSGNLFMRKSLFELLGGFRDYRDNRDWDFCLRAILEAEPVLVPDNVYVQRIHENNTIGESPKGQVEEADRIASDYFVKITGGSAPKNNFAPTVHAWGSHVLLWIARNGQAYSLAPQALQQLAERATTPAIRDAGIPLCEEPESRAFAAPAGTPFAAMVEALPQRPLISILLPTYNTPARWLHLCIGSVLDQFYPHWELCIADDASPQAHVREIIEHYARCDPRIKVIVREQNGHISRATNSALALAEGSFFALLDHDDELSPDALYWAAREITRHPDAGLIYSDEGKVDEAGYCHGPYLKPDWNPELLRAQNCVSHLGIFRTDLVRAVGGFRPGFEGAQDWDLALRISERVMPHQIRHIPRVLYHWRSIAGSTARDVSQKNYVAEAQRQALLEHYQRTGTSVSLHPIGDFWNTIYDPGGQFPRVTLIIDARGPALTAWNNCLPQLLAGTDYPGFEIVLCHDAGITPATPAPDILPLPCKPGLHTGEVYQQAVQACRGELIGVFPLPCWPADAQWLAILAGYALQKRHGAVAPKIITADGRIAFAGTLLGIGEGVAFPYTGQKKDVMGQTGRARLAQNFQALGGGFLLVSKDKLHEIGGFAPGSAGAMAAQIALCLGLREAGYWNVWAPNSVLVTGRLPDYTPDKTDLATLEDRWPDAFAGDPAYHPALSHLRLFEPA